MTGTERGRGGAAPERVAIVGAGMVGLATAWFLQEHGREVVVLDREGVAAGSSWGNAGWLTPGLAAPLPDPAVLAYGMRAMISPSSPVYVPPSTDPRLWSFLVRFLLRSTDRSWKEAMRSLVPINTIALESFDMLVDAGVEAEVRDAGAFVAAYRTEAERVALLAEIEHMTEMGQPVEHEILDGPATRAAAGCFSGEVNAGVLLHDQKFIDPGAFVAALADSVRARGGRIVEGATVRAVRSAPRGRGVELSVDSADGAHVERHDAVVLAAGSWQGDLARPHGVRTLVQAGRGYSFSVPVEQMPAGPVYLPAERVACTPLGDRLRVAGMMEFRAPDAPLDPRRVEAIVESVRPLLCGVDLDDRQDEWVGARPCTPDGLALIGATRSPGVYVAGGHGMWGITQGPVTGRLLAEQIVTGTMPRELAPFDPLR
ncbi:NAD(P)/FAD-dependent oxidoreductase [Mobilicoccus pelagius]|uniref:Putative oxidoreductase n=1 Tax=Mobilicoccus pelagius NBRC 104925 TaxID=1089455 RepID=H5UR28_9MICO|nr:FAD-dependent oxidoreductase [Mobilicoccus pelagius]GAB48186.1 putative oxidoreductase [Mobilicoccus pelagius NBRC 104925]